MDNQVRPTAQNLPSEILAQFFIPYCRDKPVPVPWEFRRSRSPLALLHVCSRWKQFAIDEPNMWRNLLFSFKGENSHFEGMIQETLGRSCGLPISLHIEGYKAPSWTKIFTSRMVPIWDRLETVNIAWGNPNNIPHQVVALYSGKRLSFTVENYRNNASLGSR